MSQARLELQEADSHRSRLTSEVVALREEAKRNKVCTVIEEGRNKQCCFL